MDGMLCGQQAGHLKVQMMPKAFQRQGHRGMFLANKATFTSCKRRARILSDEAARRARFGKEQYALAKHSIRNKWANRRFCCDQQGSFRTMRMLKVC